MKRAIGTAGEHEAVYIHNGGRGRSSRYMARCSCGWQDYWTKLGWNAERAGRRHLDEKRTVLA